MSQRVTNILKEIVRREGGLVDHPNDRGGITNYGISLRYIRNRGIDLNDDGVVDRRDIRIVTPEKALELYREDFFIKPQINVLPEGLQPVMVDWAVNSGPARPIEALQRTNTELGYQCSVDGVIGPQTIKQTNRAKKAFGVKTLIEEINDKREEFYRQIVRNDPSQEVFLQGWLNRVAEFRV